MSCEKTRQPGYDVLVQLRSLSMKAMPGHLAALGGQRDRTDTDSRHTALREVKEECGLMSKCAKGPIKFAEGARCDWYVMLLKKPTFESKAKSRHECGDIKSVIPLLPSSMQPAECYGHAWIPTSDIQNIDPKLPLMGGSLAEYNDLKRFDTWSFLLLIFLICYDTKAMCAHIWCEKNLAKQMFFCPPFAFACAG